MQSTDSENGTDADDGMDVNSESEEEGFFRRTKPLSGPSGKQGSLIATRKKEKTLSADPPLVPPARNQGVRNIGQVVLQLLLFFRP
jgi:hypothetical protein